MLSLARGSFWYKCPFVPLIVRNFSPGPSSHGYSNSLQQLQQDGTTTSWQIPFAVGCWHQPGELVPCSTLHDGEVFPSTYLLRPTPRRSSSRPCGPITNLWPYPEPTPMPIILWCRPALQDVPPRVPPSEWCPTLDTEDMAMSRLSTSTWPLEAVLELWDSPLRPITSPRLGAFWDVRVPGLGCRQRTTLLVLSLLPWAQLQWPATTLYHWLSGPPELPCYAALHHTGAPWQARLEGLCPTTTYLHFGSPITGMPVGIQLQGTRARATSKDATPRPYTSGTSVNTTWLHATTSRVSSSPDTILPCQPRSITKIWPRDTSPGPANQPVLRTGDLAISLQPPPDLRSALAPRHPTSGHMGLNALPHLCQIRCLCRHHRMPPCLLTMLRHLPAQSSIGMLTQTLIYLCLRLGSRFRPAPSGLRPHFPPTLWPTCQIGSPGPFHLVIAETFTPSWRVDPRSLPLSLIGNSLLVSWKTTSVPSGPSTKTLDPTLPWQIGECCSAKDPSTATVVSTMNRLSPSHCLRTPLTQNYPFWPASSTWRCRGNYLWPSPLPERVHRPSPRPSSAIGSNLPVTTTDLHAPNKVLHNNSMTT